MKAVIKVGGKQYIVSEGQTLLVDKLDSEKDLSLEPLMVFDEKTAKVGKPTVAGASVKAKVAEQEVKGEKLQVAKFKAKKRVKTITGHRQKHTKIEITKITA
ncbi:MAG TPA: 50S ribosomal protein L21 [Candidatus Saccharimonadales bacterium]|nr:50S ribosomal protein L21 [Candidatus Saccharimonadales bacterium]